MTNERKVNLAVAFGLVVLLVDAVTYVHIRAAEQAKPEQNRVTRFLVKPDADAFYCTKTDTGFSCRSSADVASFLNGKDCEP